MLERDLDKQKDAFDLQRSVSHDEEAQPVFSQSYVVLCFSEMSIEDYLQIKNGFPGDAIRT